MSNDSYMKLYNAYDYLMEKLDNLYDSMLSKRSEIHNISKNHSDSEIDKKNIQDLQKLIAKENLQAVFLRKLIKEVQRDINNETLPQVLKMY